MGEILARDMQANIGIRREGVSFVDSSKVTGYAIGFSKYEALAVPGESSPSSALIG